MLFQKRMDSDTGTIPQQAPYLFLVEFAGLIPDQRQTFQDMARYILPLRLDMPGNIFWQMNSHFHTFLAQPGDISVYHSRKTHALQRRGEPTAARLKDHVHRQARTADSQGRSPKADARRRNASHAGKPAEQPSECIAAVGWSASPTLRLPSYRTCACAGQCLKPILHSPGQRASGPELRPH